MSEGDPVQLVLNYIEASRRARATRDPQDLSRVRRLLADDVIVKLAGPWTDEPWRVLLTTADAVVERLQAPINAASSLTTEDANVQRAGDDVIVEQLSTISDDQGVHVSMVCHIFTTTGGVISGIRTYRNDKGLPSG